MTNEELIALISTSKNRTDLLKRLGGYENNPQNRRTYIGPIGKQLNLTSQELTPMFNTAPISTGSIAPSGSL